VGCTVTNVSRGGRRKLVRTQRLRFVSRSTATETCAKVLGGGASQLGSNRSQLCGQLQTLLRGRLEHSFASRVLQSWWGEERGRIERFVAPLRRNSKSHVDAVQADLARWWSATVRRRRCMAVEHPAVWKREQSLRASWLKQRTSARWKQPILNPLAEPGATLCLACALAGLCKVLPTKPFTIRGILQAI